MTEREALTASLVEEGKGEYYLVLSAGNHTCDRWKVRESLLKKLAIESFNLSMRREAGAAPKEYRR